MCSYLELTSNATDPGESRRILDELQHYLALTGYQWGAYAILWADAWAFETFTVQRDNVIIERIREAGERFIRFIENGPAPSRLDSSDRRCSSCPFRQTCQGKLLRESADAALGDRDDLKVLSDDKNLESLLIEYREHGCRHEVFLAVLLDHEVPLGDLHGIDEILIDLGVPLGQFRGENLVERLSADRVEGDAVDFFVFAVD